MIKPGDLTDVNEEVLNKMEKEIDESIKSYHGWYDWEQAVIAGSYPVEVRRAIALRYVKSGWKYVYHKDVSREECDGCGPLLTSFMFSNKKLDVLPGISKYRCVSYDGQLDVSYSEHQSDGINGGQLKQKHKVKFKVITLTRSFTTSKTYAPPIIPLNLIPENYNVEDAINEFISSNSITRGDIINIEISLQTNLNGPECCLAVFYWG